MKWLVEYEVRQIGAIGVWWLLADTVVANTQAEACAQFRLRHESQYEFRFPSRCERVEQ